MFTSRVVTLASVLVFALVNVVALPLRISVAGSHLAHPALAGRDPAPFEPIIAYMKRDGVWDMDLGKRDDNINIVPEELPTKGVNGVITAFNSRDIPAEMAL